MSEHSESVILDVTHFDNWADHHAGPLPTGGKRIPDCKRSTAVHTSKEVAEQEAVRLALANPGKRFAVFSFIGVVEAKSIPTHVTLGGKVVSNIQPIWHERDL